MSLSVVSCLLLAVGISTCLCAGGKQPLPVERPNRQSMMTRDAAIMSELMLRTKFNATLARLVKEEFKMGERLAETTFPCDPILPPSPVKPTSVHQLRPGDINVVAAIGDSLTAGRGSKGDFLDLLTDYRGVSWSVGGDKSYEKLTTLPNILRKFNPNLYGFSLGYGEYDARMNVAVTGAKAEAGYAQADDLIHRLYNDPKVDYYNDWKLVTVFLGANDLCDFCEDPINFQEDYYQMRLMSTLDHLKKYLPRTFVNVVLTVNVDMVEELSKGLVCGLVHAYACDCASNPPNQASIQELIRLRKAYQQKAVDLVQSGRYDTREDFTVVLQPFYVNSDIPRYPHSTKIDYSYFAADCFHYSDKGQGATGLALWNNMMQPVYAKSTSWSIDQDPICPTEENQFLHTNWN